MIKKLLKLNRLVPFLPYEERLSASKVIARLIMEELGRGEK
jgi:hypothetical protein